MNDRFELFCQLTKVDLNTHEVWGRATAQQKDLARETMHYDTSKPNFQKWSQDAMDRTAILGPEGVSLGNIRQMHQPIAAGKAIAIDYNDMDKAIDIGTVCTDDPTWEKIRTGTLTGFSIGGTAKRWRDPMSQQIFYTAEPQEISYVDAPCLPSAQFKLIKADGSEIMEKVGYGLTAADENPAIAAEGANAIIDGVDVPEGAGAVETVPSGEIVKEIAAPASGAPNPALIEQRAVLPISSPRTEPVEKSAVDNLLALIKAQHDSEQRAIEMLKAYGARVGIHRREGAPLDTGPGYSKNSADWGDPANLRWPMDNLERLDTAIAKYNSGQDLHGYELRERSILGHRLAKQARLIRGGDYYYDATKRQIMKVEAPKMLPTLEKGVDLGGLVSQLMQGINVAVDQIGKDPNAARDLLMQLMGNVSSATTTSSVDTGTSNPTPPTGSQQGYTDTTVGKAAMSGTPSVTLATALTPSTPSVPTGGGLSGTSGSTPMSEASGTPLSTPQSAPTQSVPSTATTGPTMDKAGATTASTPATTTTTDTSTPATMDKRDEQIDNLTKQLSQLTQIVSSIVNPGAPIQKMLQPLANVMPVPAAPAEPEMHPALRKLLETGDVVAAARVLNPERPDITALRELARGQALREGQSDFTNMALRKGYLTQNTFTPSLPETMPAYPAYAQQ